MIGEWWICDDVERHDGERHEYRQSVLQGVPINIRKEMESTVLALRQIALQC